MSVYKKTKSWKTFRQNCIAVCIIILLLAILIFINHYQSDTSFENVKEPSITIIITQDFGKSIFLSKEVTIEGGESAMDVLNEVADITCIYGGGFVESINGVKSQYAGGEGERKDWFYYINGMLASVGATQYKLHSGDIEHWDFHDWRLDRMVTAIIGDYPEPFLHGYNGRVAETSIVYADEFYEAATGLQQSLEKQGVSISMKRFEELSEYEKRSHNLILIDTYENELIAELNANADQLGWFIEFDGKYIITLDETGEKDTSFDHGGVILATQNPWNPKGNWHCENVVWVVTGVTHEDVVTASEILITSNEEIKNCTSIILAKRTIYKVP
ncbi:MAG: hypothetical protein DRQ24_11050 [Candidatus Latescibacterota bacterium]|nr:MAG: hypothetical protein DRQ24_11050 [Candidatus Latescibacterota bacterium]